MANVKDVRAREILDSRGNPTVACHVFLDDDTVGTGFIPSGASKGKNEALELRDDDPKRYGGKGVLKAIANVNGPIRDAVLGMDAANLSAIDKKMIELDATENKSKLGANAILSVSLAVAKAASKSAKIPFYRYLANLMGKNLDNEIIIPIPFLNILNGGKHAIGSTDFQEFMIVPVKFPTFHEAIRVGTEIYRALGKILEDRSYQPLVGDEGGFAPSLFSNEQAMELLVLAIQTAGYHPGENVFIALDPAASRFFSEDIYQLHRENRSLTTTQMVDFYMAWTEKYPIISIEDGLAETDWAGWQNLTQRLGSKIELIGDDLYATNKNLLKKGIETRATTGILIKPNQIGTLTETLETMKLAEDSGFKIIISHRSGETEDDFIADLAVASGCGVIKSGAPCRAERTVKYNRLLEIEEKEPKAKYASWDTSVNLGFTQI
ncbi:MAG: phosphopyruvate hydratase [Patescibacteria group bacterium]|jgi:enolase